MDLDPLAEHGLDLLAHNTYLTLGTVGPDGHPWTTPVYYASDNLQDFYWASSPESQHSRNLAAHPEMSLAVFDSTVPPYHGRCLYAAGVAGTLSGDELQRGLAVYPGPVSRGGTVLTVDDVTGSVVDSGNAVMPMSGRLVGGARDCRSGDGLRVESEDARDVVRMVHEVAVAQPQR